MICKFRRILSVRKKKITNKHTIRVQNLPTVVKYTLCNECNLVLRVTTEPFFSKKIKINYTRLLHKTKIRFAVCPR